MSMLWCAGFVVLMSRKMCWITDEVWDEHTYEEQTVDGSPVAIIKIETKSNSKEGWRDHFFEY